MERFKIFIKKNSFFVILCLVFLAIALSLMGYKLTMMLPEENSSSKPQSSQTQTPIGDSTPEFTSFIAEYDKNNAEVNLSWKLSSDTGVKRILLYWVKDVENKVEIELQDVTNYSSYSLMQNTYGFTNGVNTFKIKAILENGKTVEDEAVVELPLVLSVSQDEVMKSNGSAEVTVTYVYGKQRKVEPPKIIVSPPSNEVAMSWELVGTKTSESGDFVTAKTTYRFKWDPSAILETFNIRWYFADDNSSYNRDFMTTFQINQ